MNKLLAVETEQLST